MAIKENGNLNTDKDTKTDYSILKGIQEDLFELQRQIDESGDPIRFKDVTIEDIDGTNFELQVLVNSSSVAPVDLTFTDYSAAEPIPTEVSLSDYEEQIDESRVFTLNTLTFDDPAAAVGESYTFVLDARDEQGQSLHQREWTVTVQ